MADQKIIIANWKMNLDLPESVALAREVRSSFEKAPKPANVEIAVCPSFDALAAVHDELADSGILVGAQDVFWQERGAFTGEISADMLKAAGASLVIVGHSERRKYLHEDDAMINLKVRAALSRGLMPVLCVGETYEERSAGHTDLILMRQVIGGLGGIALKPDDRVIVAYEPVWVIGTGQAIEPSMAEHASQVINQSLIDLFSLGSIAKQIRVIYGGSVDPDNIMEYTGILTMHGALVGTASVNAEKFLSLISKL